MKTTTNPGATVQTFKSDRAAKLAFSKAMTAYKAAQSAAGEYSASRRGVGWCEEAFATHRALEAVRDEKLAAAGRIYEAAKASGFQLYTFDARWHFGNHATRDLIAANID